MDTLTKCETGKARAAEQEVRPLAQGYAHVLRFTRLFTSGTLTGMTHEDSIPFCTALDAEEWVAGVNRNNAKGSVNYKVVSWNLT